MHFQTPAHFSPGEIFKDPQRGPSFGELHAKYAKESMEEAIQSGDGIFEAFQGGTSGNVSRRVAHLFPSHDPDRLVQLHTI